MHDDIRHTIFYGVSLASSFLTHTTIGCRKKSDEQIDVSRSKRRVYNIKLSLTFVSFLYVYLIAFKSPASTTQADPGPEDACVVAHLERIAGSVRRTLGRAVNEIKSRSVIRDRVAYRPVNVELLQRGHCRHMHMCSQHNNAQHLALPSRAI